MAETGLDDGGDSEGDDDAEDYEEDGIESLDSDDDDDDLDDDLMSREFIDQEDHHSYLDEGGEDDFARGVDLDELHQYHNQHLMVEQLNASTADFNKEIKQINNELIREGHLSKPLQKESARQSQKKSQVDRN